MLYTCTMHIYKMVAQYKLRRCKEFNADVDVNKCLKQINAMHQTCALFSEPLYNINTLTKMKYVLLYYNFSLIILVE